MIGLFIDFYDSFSHNIIDELIRHSLNIETIYWNDEALSLRIKSPKYSFIILGPGPGHVDDYENIQNLVINSLTINKKVIGFCLGHQLIAKALGFQIAQLDRPLHGKSFPIKLSNHFIENEFIHNVQFYNSWYVKKSSMKYKKSLVLVVNENSMICALRGKGHLSYQFHPESVGTTCPYVFFSFIKKFLYNEDDVGKEIKI